MKTIVVIVPLPRFLRCKKLFSPESVFAPPRVSKHTLFYIRTTNFGAEAERSYIFLRFEAENILKMFLNLQGIKVMKTGLHGLPT